MYSFMFIKYCILLFVISKQREKYLHKFLAINKQSKLILLLSFLVMFLAQQSTSVCVNTGLGEALHHGTVPTTSLFVAVKLLHLMGDFFFLMFAADNMSDEGDSDRIKTVFQNDQGKKTIDVYWIADDGGE